jgi:hypothetical protein
VSDRVVRHVEAFNRAQVGGEWAEFGLRFAHDARMSFAGVLIPVSPGRTTMGSTAGR